MININWIIFYSKVFNPGKFKMFYASSKLQSKVEI